MATALLYRGGSLSSARLPAGRAVPIAVSAPASRLVATIGGREVGRAEGTELDTVSCDLRGLSGRVGIRVARTSGRITENIDKAFVAVPVIKPGPDNTGPRPGVTLTTSPQLTFRTAGEVIEGRHFAGAVRVMADDVVFRDCLFQHTSINLGGPGRRTVLDHCEIDGLGQGSNGIMLPDLVMRWCNVWNVCDGARLSGSPLIEDSWFHDLFRQGAWHPDCLQTTGSTDAMIRRCVLDAYSPASGDLNNAAVQIGGETAALVNFTVEDCWVNGGNYTINVGWGQPGNMVGPIVLRNIDFGPDYRYGELVHARAANVVTEDLTRFDGTPVVAAYHD